LENLYRCSNVLYERFVWAAFSEFPDSGEPVYGTMEKPCDESKNFCWRQDRFVCLNARALI
jgi:hypothetical protein